MTATADDIGANPFRPVPAMYVHVDVQDRPWPVHQVGTGGLGTAFFYAHAPGYQPFVLLLPAADAAASQPYADLMEQIKRGFGRTMSRLPRVFGVTRQTLYNWLAGETPRALHHEKLRQLAAAADVFTQAAYKPDAIALDRTLEGGKSILELIASGADGRVAAKKLVDLQRRGASARSKLDRLTAGRSPRDDTSVFSAPAVSDEE
jgi:hypothetical protein